MATNKTRLLNMGLHGATMGTRFLFIFFLAKNLDPRLVGYYGLFTVTVGYSLYFVGLDFYTYASREILNTPQERRGQLLKGQLALSGLLYLLFIPGAFTLLVQFANWPWYLMLWFLPIVVLEHINQEVYRLLIAMSEQISASVILFIRQGSWALAIVALMTLDPAARALPSVLACWAIAGVAAACAGAWKLRSMQLGGWGLAVDWRWVRKGVAVSTAFLLSTLALRGIQTFDRYWVEALGGLDIVGAYVLFLGVAGTLLTFLDAGIFSFSYPMLVKLHLAHDIHALRTKVNSMFASTIMLCAAFAMVSWLVLPFLLQWINKPVYSSSMGLYAWLLAATIISAISMVPHYALYARGCDRPLIQSHVAALFVFLLITWMLSDRFPQWAVPAGLNAAFSLVLIWKCIWYWKLTRQTTVPQPAQTA